MNQEHEPGFAFPSGLSDREASLLCDFLFQLVADAKHITRATPALPKAKRSNAPKPRSPMGFGLKRF